MPTGKDVNPTGTNGTDAHSGSAITGHPDKIRLGDHDYPPTFAAVAWSHQDPDGYVMALHEAETLGYLRAADEWTHGIEPLSERLQDVAHRLVEAGRIPAETYGLEAR